MRIDLTLGQISALKAMLADACADDEQLWLDTIEGETDSFEIVRRMLDGIEAEEGTRDALTAQMEARKIRRDRCDTRIIAHRQAIMAVMACAELDKLALPEATLSLRTLAASLKVNDAAAVPEGYCVPKFVPDMDKIRAAFSVEGGLPNWLRVEPERPSLTVRRK